MLSPRKCLSVVALLAAVSCGEPQQLEVTETAPETIPAPKYEEDRLSQVRELAADVRVLQWTAAVQENAEAAKALVSADRGAFARPPAAVSAQIDTPATAGACAIPAHICQRESNFNPTVVSPNGLWHGKYQFTQGTWNHAVAGAGHPEYVGVPPEQVPETIQDAAAAWLWSQPGGCGHWGSC